MTKTLDTPNWTEADEADLLRRYGATNPDLARHREAETLLKAKAYELQQEQIRHQKEQERARQKAQEDRERAYEREIKAEARRRWRGTSESFEESWPQIRAGMIASQITHDRDELYESARRRMHSIF